MSSKTMEDAILLLCPDCGAEHWVDKRIGVEVCDICNHTFAEPEENEDDDFHGDKA